MSRLFIVIIKLGSFVIKRKQKKIKELWGVSEKLVRNIFILNKGKELQINPTRRTNAGSSRIN